MVVNGVEGSSDNLCSCAGITVGQSVDFDGLIRGGQNGKGQLDGANDSRDEGLLVTPRTPGRFNALTMRAVERPEVAVPPAGSCEGA
jgi:hypothetical protein